MISSSLGVVLPVIPSSSKIAVVRVPSQEHCAVVYKWKMQRVVLSRIYYILEIWHKILLLLVFMCACGGNKIISVVLLDGFTQYLLRWGLLHNQTLLCSASLARQLNLMDPAYLPPELSRTARMLLPLCGCRGSTLQSRILYFLTSPINYFHFVYWCFLYLFINIPSV